MHDIQKQYEHEIIELVTASNRLANLGYVTSHGGNLSLRTSDGSVLITPTKVSKRAIVFDDICVVTPGGAVLYAAPGRKPTGEMPFHLRIFAKRPDIYGIVHAHPPILTGFAIAGGDYMAMPFLPEPIIEVGPMLMVPYAMPLSDDLAEQFDPYIDKSNGFLMENHGALMCSPDGVMRALEFLEMMESAAISILVAKSLGNARTIPMPDVLMLEQVLKIRNMPLPGRPGIVKSLADIYKAT